MTPVIRIDDEVMDELKKRAVALGLVFEPPNATLRRVLGLDVDRKALVDEIVGNAIELKLSASSRKDDLIPLPKKKRPFFPDFKESFEMVTDVGVHKANVTSAPDTGGHIRGKLRPWFEKHQELKTGDRLRIEAIEPGKRYKLSIVSQRV